MICLEDETGTSKLKFLFYAIGGFMGSFNQAVAQGFATGTTPDISTVRARRVKVGGGVNLESFWHGHPCGAG